MEENSRPRVRQVTEPNSSVEPSFSDVEIEGLVPVLSENIPRARNGEVPEASLVEVPSLWSGIENFLQSVLNWLSAYWWVLLLILCLVGGIWYLIRKLRRRQKEIQKLWLFTLFFLQKRQMMIPLVITLSKKDGLLDAKMQKTLLEIRDRCREVPFKKHPLERLKLEEEVSEILFYYFSQLSKEDRIKPGTKFAKINQDLEFIDAKLVQMQKVYNDEVVGWNRLMNWPGLKHLLRLFRFPVFEPF